MSVSITISLTPYVSVTFHLELGEPAKWDLEQEYDFMFKTLRPRQDGRHFPDDIFKCIILNENVWILIKISLKFVPKVRNSNIPALVQIMAWRRPGDKPLSEPMIVKLPTHICVTRQFKTVKSISSTLWILSIYSSVTLTEWNDNCSFRILRDIF